MIRTPSIVAALAPLALLGGCYLSPMQQLDRDVTRMIRRHQFEALGPDNATDPNPLPSRPDRTRLTARDYAHSPRTTNPTPQELPARSAGDVVLDPDSDEYRRATQDTGHMLTLNLEQVLAYAIEHSRDYRDAKEQLYLAAIDLLAEQHLWGPRFFSDTTAELSGTPESGDHDHVASLLSDLRVTKRLPYGGQVSVAALVSFVEALRNESADPSFGTQTGEVSVSVTLPLLRGAGQVAREELIQAHRELVYETRRFERFRRGFLVDIASDYFDLLQGAARIRNQQSQLNNLEWLYRRVSALSDAGREPPFEVRRSENEVLDSRNELLGAEEEYARQLDAFKIRIGMALAQRLALQPIDIEVPIPLLDEVAATSTAWSNRLDYQTVQDRVADAARLVELARNGLLADLNVEASLSLATDPDKKRAGFDLDAGAGSYSVGARLSAPLDRRLEQLALRRSLIALERSKRDRSLSRDTVASEVRRSIRQIELAMNSLEIQNKNLEQAQLRRDEVALRLRAVGQRDFIEAEEALVRALDARDAAIRNLRVNVLVFLLNTGQMRVGPTGQWLPPAKLVEAEPAPVAPPAARLMGRQGRPEDADNPQAPAQTEQNGARG